MSKRKNLKVCLAVLVMLMGIGSTIAAGKTIYVDGDAPGPFHDGTSWATAYKYLQDALGKAASGDDVWLAEGTYKPDQGGGETPDDPDARFELINGVVIQGGYAGYGEPDPDARDIDLYETILSGDIGKPADTDNSYHVVVGLSVNESAVMDGLTITAGSGGPSDGGGGMLNRSSTPTLTYCTFSGNSATGSGGGMYNLASSPTLTDCVFIGNSAVNSGGGMFNVQASSPTLINCTFIGNSADTNFGGGMYNFGNSSPTLTGCSFSDNSADKGGGMYNHDGCNPTLTSCSFIANPATSSGGGVYNSDNGPTMTGCSFNGNSAATFHGGGIYDTNSSPTLTNCVFSGNSANSGVGGGIANYNNSNPAITNCSFSGNSASSGGGIGNFLGTSPTVLNCILWTNSDSGGSDESAQIHGGTPVVTYTCVRGLDTFSGGTGNIGDDPSFVDANGPDDVVGTEDDDLHLLEGSPAIDAGHPGPQYQDLDGTRNDMGAFGGPLGDLGGVGSHSGTGFVFTSIGNIPISEIVKDSNSTSHGLVYVPDANIANMLGIPEYKDSPVARTLWIHGLFGDGDDVDFYQILAGKWNDGNEPNSQDYVTLSDSLTKVEYYIDPCTSTWTYRYVTLGPKSIDGKDNLYQLTDEGYWSHIDLRIRWNTRVYENGKYTLTYRAYHWSDPCQTTLVDANLPATGWDHVTLVVDNSPVTATIHNVKYDPCSPYYDDPCDGEIPECAIINLTDANENLRFTITAWHANGYLRRWILDALYGKNRYAGVIASDSYTPVSPPYWNGVTEQEFQSEDSGSLDPWQQCAYQFRLRAYSRATNGYNYVISKEFNDHYYLDFGGYSCQRADVDNSGTIDLKDVAELANHWMETCGP